MKKKTVESTFTLNKGPESELPPCGCATGDLLEQAPEGNLCAIGDLSVKETGSEPPPCGCAIGDLFDKQVETNSPPIGGTTIEQSKRR